MFEQVYDTLPGNGWLTKDEAELLWTVAQYKGDILEVGCYQGRSTCLLAATGRRVHVVDPFEGFSTDDPDGEKTFAAFRANMSSRSLVNVHLYKTRIEEWTPAPVTLAYLDGDHTYKGTVTQIEVALKCGATVIAIHDVNDTGEGREIKMAATKLLGPWNTRTGRLAVWLG